MMGAASRVGGKVPVGSLRARVVERVEEIEDPGVLELVDTVISLADQPYSDTLAMAVLMDVFTQVAERRLRDGAEDHPDRGLS